MKKIIENKKYLIFIILSILFLGFMVCFYGYRLIHFYLIENPTGSKIQENVTLSSTIINKNKIVNEGDGLYVADKNYVFKGKVDNNYVYYSGLLWRIIKINKDDTIKLVSNETLTTLYRNNSESLEKSILNNWLNDKVLTNLSNNEYLINVDTCVDSLEDINKTNCDKYSNNQKIGFLSVDEYINALGKQSYLNNGKSYWLSNSDNNGNTWYVNNDGGISNVNSDGNHGIRATITLKKGLVSISGEGTADNPFIIENNKFDNLSQINNGSYLKYSEYIWRVIDKNDKSIKVVLDGYLSENRIFDNYSNSFNSNISIGKYLNVDFYNTLNNKDYIVNGDFYIGSYNNYDYKNIYNHKITAKIGLLSIGDLFVNEYNNIFLNNPYDTEGIVYTIDNNYYLFGNSITSSLKVRPVLYLDNRLLIKSGNGLKNSPFEISK